ncbi:hypothetical protein D3C77_577150 [compost metagenome]
MGRNRRPDKHRCLRLIYFPSECVQAIAQNIPSALISFTRRLHAALIPRYRGDRCLLDRQKHAIIHVRLQYFQAGDNLLISYAKTDSCPSQPIRFGQGIKLNANLFRTREGEKAAAAFAIED